MAAPPERHVSTIPINWKAIEEETRQDSNWVDWEDARPLDTSPTRDALREQLDAAKDRATASTPAQGGHA